jgi:hypothetical protein
MGLLAPCSSNFDFVQFTLILLPCAMYYNVSPINQFAWDCFQPPPFSLHLLPICILLVFFFCFVLFGQAAAQKMSKGYSTTCW